MGYGKVAQQWWTCLWAARDLIAMEGQENHWDKSPKSHDHSGIPIQWTYLPKAWKGVTAFQGSILPRLLPLGFNTTLEEDLTAHLEEACRVKTCAKLSSAWKSRSLLGEFMKELVTACLPRTLCSDSNPSDIPGTSNVPGRDILHFYDRDVAPGAAFALVTVGVNRCLMLSCSMSRADDIPGPAKGSVRRGNT
ncbi:hypothetical protein BDV93DRAFT_514772 [Ceratobasidium sp. AG-I]|nr:hypothetical protein BDV93DRAFT_514772 [Ceratobasidium sp. AG-I]